MVAAAVSFRAQAASNSSGVLYPSAGVEPQPIVVVFDELFEVGVQFIDVLILIGIDLFPLEGLDEALAEGIVVRITGTAHAAAGCRGYPRVRVYWLEAYWMPRSE